MKNYLRKALLFTLCLLAAHTALAHDFAVDGIYYNILTDSTAEVTYKGTSSYSASYSGTVNIPASVIYNDTTYGVKSIGEYAFNNCDWMRSVTIPNSITSIGSNAFSNCTGLTSVNIPYGVISIGENAFSGCTSLTSAPIPNSVASIGEGAFSNCTGLLSVVIPNMVTSIGAHTFAYCTGLTSVNIPNSINSIGRGAFRECTGLTSVTIPNSVTSIGKSAFESCKGITSVTIPVGVTNIGSAAFAYSGLTEVYYAAKNCVVEPCNIELGRCYGGVFSGCDELSKIVIDENVKEIPDYLFSGCAAALTSVTIPNDVTRIGVCAFAACEGLKSVVIPNTVTSIGDFAFWYCYNLSSVTMSSNVTELGRHMFCGTNLVSFKYSPDPEEWINSHGYDNCPATFTVEITCNKIQNASYVIKSGAYFSEQNQPLKITANAEDFGGSVTVRLSANEATTGVHCSWNNPYKATSGIKDVILDYGEPEIIGYYDQWGRKLSRPAQGINIIRYSDGTSRKVVVK